MEDAETPGVFTIQIEGESQELVWSIANEANQLREDEVRALPSPGVLPNEIAYVAHSAHGLASTIREARTGKLVAYSVALPESRAHPGGHPTTLYCLATAVEPRYQRHGLASRQLGALIEDARQGGFTELTAIVMPQGRQSGADDWLRKFGARITRLMPTPAEAADLTEESVEQIQARYRETNAELDAIYTCPDLGARLPELLERNRHAMLELRMPLRAPRLSGR